MKPGDMVQPVGLPPGSRGLFIYHDWMDIASKTGDRLRDDQIALVLESLEPQGGNGCKILLPSGAVGWCTTYYLEVVRVECGKRAREEEEEEER